MQALSSRVTFAPRVAQRAARRSPVSTRAAADRPLWNPGAKAPAHLDGSMIGDYGFDPLRLAVNPETRNWLIEGERMNGRWAMLAVAGILTNDLLGLSEKWWIPDNSGHLAPGTEYPGGPRVLFEIIFFAAVESFRVGDFVKNGPGAKAFDPAGMNGEDRKLKEIKNGRLAMVAFLGFTSQAAVRGLGPIECLKLHLSAPAKENIFTSAVSTEATCAVAALAIAPMIIRFIKEKSGDEDDFRPIPW